MSEAFDAFKRAKERGLNVVVLDDDRFIGLDLDDGAEIDTAVHDMLIRHGMIRPGGGWLTTVSQNGNKHIYIPIDPAPMERRVAIQAVLGSDRLKEAFSLMRLHHTLVTEGEPCGVLFETDEGFRKFQEWKEGLSAA